MGAKPIPALGKHALGVGGCRAHRPLTFYRLSCRGFPRVWAARHLLEGAFSPSHSGNCPRGGSGRALASPRCTGHEFRHLIWDVLPEECSFAIQFALGAATTESATISPRGSGRVLTLIGVLVVQKCARDEVTERLLSNSEHWFMKGDHSHADPNHTDRGPRGATVRSRPFAGQ